MHTPFWEHDCFSERCLRNFLSLAKKHNKKANLRVLKKAFLFSKDAHAGQVRASGKAFFCHPLETAALLAKLGLSSNAVAAGLLHDILEDTDVTEKKLKMEFGGEILGLVEGVTKIDLLASESKFQQKSESLHSLLLATTRDPRVILIKLADKLHNLRTLHYLPKRDRVRIAEETLVIYVPIAHKIGVEEMAVEIEDLAFKYAKPEAFKVFSRKVSWKRMKKDHEINLMIPVLRKKMKKANFYKRRRSVYSIYTKLQNTGKVLAEVNDSVILNVIVDSKADCYSALGVIHGLFPPLPNKVKDFIATPKPSFYRLLQTSVFGPTKKSVKVRIATLEMDTLNRFGVVAYRKFTGKRLSGFMKHNLSKLDSILKNGLGKETFDFLKVDFLAEPVFVFNSKGVLYELPKKSTVLDFAFASEKKWALHLLSAKVDGKSVSYGKRLESGNVVEFVLGKKNTAKKEWLKQVRGYNSKKILKAYFGKKS